MISCFFFSRKNGSKTQEDFWKAKKSHFEASGANCGRSAAVRAGPGEGKKGWGKALGAGILGFAFEAGHSGRYNRKVKGLISGTLGSPFGRRWMCYAQTVAPEGMKRIASEKVWVV